MSRAVWATIAVVLLGGACSDDADTSGGPDAADTSLDSASDQSDEDGTSGPVYAVTIRRTAHGVPHILAEDWGSLGYGTGYAQAQDHICTLADQVVKVRSERARFFGPGPDDSFVNSDFAFLHLGFYDTVESGLSEQPEELRDALSGFADGYNRYLADTGLSALPPECADSDWVRPITAADVAAMSFQLAMLTSSLQLLDLIATAVPPGASTKSEPVLDLEGLPDFRDLGFGSNGWALGAERTEHEGGLLLVNPHFPWEGELRFWEMHLTIPGELNVYGGTLLGAPFPVIGFNETAGWTHTVSLSQQLTGYYLNLPPGEPTSYRYDGETRQMTAHDYTIEVLQPDESLETLARTLFRSHYGPILNVPPLGWSSTIVLTYRDANENNTTLGEQYLAMARATDIDALLEVMETHRSIPLTHTIAVDSAGDVLYADVSQVPNLATAAIEAWLEQRDSDVLVQTAWEQFGLVLLEGRDTMFEWVADAGARVPGVVPFEDSPQLRRRDFVVNGNNSHWMANPAQPLEGFSPMFGFEREIQLPRPRSNVWLVTQEGDDSFAGADGRWSVADVEAMFFGGRAIIEALWRDDLVERCDADGSVSVDGEPVSLEAACDVLRDWGGTQALDDPGAVLFREVLGGFALEDYLSGRLFSEPFDPSDPVGTPYGLAPAPEEGEDPALVALAEAIVRLEEGGFDIDATLGDLQFFERAGVELPVPGGLEAEGSINNAGWSGLNSSLLPGAERDELLNGATQLTTRGYQMNYGSSLVLAIRFDNEGPVGRGLVTYSQSDNPDSNWVIDQTELFGQEHLRDLAFTEADIAADPDLQVLELSAP